MTRAHQPGQAAVEAAITAAMVIMTMMVTLQLSLVVAQAFSAMYVAQSTARWLAVRIDTVDADVQTQANLFAANLPGMAGGGLASVVITPGCSATATPPTYVSSKCTLREFGNAIQVTVNTSLTPVMFLPSTFGVSPFVFHLPTAMPAISYTVLLE